MTALVRPALNSVRAAFLLFALGAVAVGVLVTTKPLFGMAFVGGIAVFLFVLRDFSFLPYLLCSTVFVESVSLGPGLRVGRVVGAIALLVIAIVMLSRGANGLRSGWLGSVAVVYGLWILASYEWASAPSTVSSEVFSFVLSASYALAIAVLVRSDDQAVRIGNVLALGAAIFGAVAFVHFIRHVSAGGTGVDLSERSSGLQGDPNYFAVVQVISLPPTLVLATLETRRLLRLAYFATVGIIVISVVSSLSRTGLLALTTVVFLTTILPWPMFFTAAREKTKFLFWTVAGTVAASFVGSTTIIARVRTIFNPNAAGGYGGAGREDLWRAALHGWRQSDELIGMGAGNFRYHSLDLLQTTPGVDTTKNYVGPFREVHNAYLESLTDLGVIGLLIFLLLLALTVYYLYRSYRRALLAEDQTLRMLSIAFMVSFAGYAVSAFFLSNQLAKGLWILVGIALAFDVMSRRALEARLRLRQHELHNAPRST